MRLTNEIFVVGGKQLGLSGPWDSHIYLIKGKDGLVMIDAGGGGYGETIAANIASEGLNPKDINALLITHNHPDHACGAAEIRELTGCEVYISTCSCEQLQSGDEHSAGLATAKEMGIYPPEFSYRNCIVDHEVRDQDEINVAGITFTAIGVEGHSPDSICYQVELNGKRHLFSGDVLFYGGILGLINFPGSSMSGYRKQLKKLSGLKIDGLFPGHLLFTLNGGQEHIDVAIEQCRKSTVPQAIGQMGYLF
jgi:glyoxylase-like metal-dependent hydrolase (beta-lactamase superfamily II)